MEELGTVEVVEALSGTVEELERYVEMRDLSDEQVMTLLEAEKAGKDRKSAKKILGKRLEEEDDGLLEEAREDVRKIKSIIEQVDNQEDFSNAVNTDHIEVERLIEVTSGTVDELQAFIEARSLSTEALEELLEAEESLKNRKTAIELIKKEIAEIQAASDIQNVEEDVEELEEDLEQLERDMEKLEPEEKVDRLADSIDSSTGDIAEAMKSIQNEESLEDQETGEEGEELDDEDDAEDSGELDEEEEAGEDENEELEEIEDEDIEDWEEDPGEDIEEQEDEDETNPELEEKKEILEELDVDMSDEQLEELTLDELKKLRDDKTEREELIEELEDDFDREVLRKASIDDLKKIKQSMEEDSGEVEVIGAGSKSEDHEVEEEEMEEMREEAEEELEMLMGAVGHEEEEEESSSFRDQLDDIRDFRNSVRDILKRGGDESDNDNGARDRKVLELLEKYKDLENEEEAAIKTAQIMKGYLEYKEGIERELTYRELADKIRDKRGKNVETLREFFDGMHVDQYTGDLDVSDIDEIINASRKVVKGY